MTMVRLLADDLTGALDTAAELVPLAGPMPVSWSPDALADASGSRGLDSGTRELDAAAAAVRVGGLLRLLDGADIAFKKIDSLLRGPTLPEIAACMQSGRWRHCVLAPAFPYQGRVTRGGRQFARSTDGWTAVGGDIVAALRSAGVTAQVGRADTGLQPGVSVFDAETDGDLRRIVAAVQRSRSRVLWAGTGGLAQALAAGRHHPALSPLPNPVLANPALANPALLNPALPKPVLGLFGSDQAATAGQLAACDPHWLEIEDDASDAVPRRLDADGLALVSFRLPAGTGRAAAATHIASAIGRLTLAIRPPGTVVAAGGETLRSLCNAVGASHLLVQGRLVPGVPHSVIQGGRWDGVTVVSKSGAFGHSLLLRELILERDDGAGLPQPRAPD